MKLTQLQIQGYKSIDGERGQTIPLGDITVLLGANGSGKSNLVSFFKMLNFMTTGALQQYIGKQGASRLLFYGPKQTESISFALSFTSESADDTYTVKLSHGLPDRLFISGEKVTYHKPPAAQPQGAAMIRLHSTAEGQTERLFSTKVLKPHQSYCRCSGC